MVVENLRAKLDLHGVKHQDADRLVENFILMNQNSMPLTIICGNSNKMIEIANQTINRIGCKTFRLNYSTIIVEEFK
jgi:DNA polymerase III delta subunit